MRTNLLMVLLAALAVSLAQPNELIPMGSLILGALGLILLFWSLRNTDSLKEVLLLGTLYAMVSTPIQVYWLFFFKDYTIFTIGGVTLGMVLYFLLWFPIFWYIIRQAPGVLQPLLVGAAWAFYEYFKSNGFLAFPWGLIPYPFHEFKAFLQSVEWYGIYFLSFLLAAFQAFWARVLPTNIQYKTKLLPLDRLGTPSHYPKAPENVEQNPRALERLKSFPAFSQATLNNLSVMAKPGIFIHGLLALAVILGVFLLDRDLGPSQEVDLALIQQNTDPWIRTELIPGLQRGVEQSTLALEAIPEPPDLVVWSETSLRYPWTNRNFYSQYPPGNPLIPFINRANVPFLFGIPVVLNESTYYNSTILVDGEAMITQWYGKIQLVPFTEYIPFWDLEIVQTLFQAIGIGGSWSKGESLTKYRLPVKSGPDVYFGTPICFEDGFTWVSRAMALDGSQFFINLTNDSWSQTDSAQIQHYVVALFRSIETRKPLVRSSNGGLTGVIDPFGRLVSGPLPFFTPGFLRTSVSIYPEAHQTAYTITGDWFALLLMGFLTAFFLIQAFGPMQLPSSKGVALPLDAD